MPGPLALIEDGPAASERVVALRGELDVGTTPALREWLSRASEGGRRSLVVDLTHVEFMAVSGLYVLCDEQARMARNRARLTVICDNASLLHLFEVCRLGDVLHVVSSRSQIPSDARWEPADEERAERLVTWLERYASGQAGPDEAPPTSSSPPLPPSAS